MSALTKWLLTYWLPIGALALSIMTLLVLVWIFLPSWLVRRRYSVSCNKERFDIEDGYRKTIGQIITFPMVAIGAFITIGGAFITIVGGLQTYRASTDAAFLQRYQYGFESLSKNNAVIKIGGMYILQTAIEAQPDRAAPILTSLAVAIKDMSPLSTSNVRAKRLPPAAQIALTIIGSRSTAPDLHFDFGHSSLRGAILTLGPVLPADNVNFNGSNFDHTDLSGSDFYNARLEFTNLRNADLRGSSSGWGAFKERWTKLCKFVPRD